MWWAWPSKLIVWLCERRSEISLIVYLEQLTTVRTEFGVRNQVTVWLLLSIKIQQKSRRCPTGKIDIALLGVCDLVSIPCLISNSPRFQSNKCFYIKSMTFTCPAVPSITGRQSERPWAYVTARSHANASLRYVRARPHAFCFASLIDRCQRRSAFGWVYCSWKKICVGIGRKQFEVRKEGREASLERGRKQG